MIDFNNQAQVIGKLNELKEKKLPHLNIDIFRSKCSYFDSIIDEASEDEKVKINEYLNKFYLPEKENKCIFNDEYPSLQWGIRHGSAYDQLTGLEWICIHYFIINGKKRKVQFSLQFHPDCYKIGDEE